MNSDFPIQELRAQLEQAAKADPEQKYFGADLHKYRWNPPASPEEVEAFEQKIGVSLPEEYRNFLLQAGNGGAGPFCGLFSLEQVESWMEWELEPDQPPYLSPEQCDEDWEESEENWKRGCIPIESQGDTYFTCLMVTGPNRGRVVYLDYEGSWVFFPREPGFLCWYQRWLRETCLHYNKFWFGTNLDGDEQELQAQYREAKTEEDKLSILHSMDKFPSFSPQTMEFLKAAICEWLHTEDAREFLQLAYRISPEFLFDFLEKRWETGQYDAAVQEIWYAQWHIRQETDRIIQSWYAAILEKLPQLSEDTQVCAVDLLQKSSAVRLEQVRPIFEQAKDPENRLQLPTSLSRFEETAENLDLWLLALEERKDLNFLKKAILCAPTVCDPRLKESISRIQKDFSSSVEALAHFDYDKEDSTNQFSQLRQEEDVWERACNKWKDLWYEEINPKVPSLPRPYRLTIRFHDRMELHMDQTPPANGIPVHPIVATAIRHQFQRLPSVAFFWKQTLGKIKALTLTPSEKLVRLDNKTRTAEICAPGDYPPPKPYYYTMENWSVIGRMKKLKKLTISQICVEDFSFLPQCQSLEHLSLYNTNFSDCRLLLQIPQLKSVDLRLCRLEHTEALKSAPFSVCLNDTEE